MQKTRSSLKNVEGFFNSNKKLVVTVGAFAIMIIYGALFLMVAYTQGGLKHLLLPAAKQKFMPFLLLPQLLGVVIGAYVAGKLVSKLNVRWIMAGAFLISAIALLLVSFLDDIAHAQSANAIISYVFITFIFGVAIGHISPLVNMLISALFSGSKRTTALAGLNGMYGIGAGILPLLFTNFVFRVSHNNTFSSVRYFYFIAIGMAVLGLCLAFIIDYKHSPQLTSKNILDKQKPAFSITKPLLLGLTMIVAYLILETTNNFMFVNVATAATPGHYISGNWERIAIRAFGLYIMTQGLWRVFSGLFVTPHVKAQYFLYMSAVLIIIGFSWTLAFGLEHAWSAYFIAVLLGFGIGNLWPVIYGYTVGIDERRGTYIGAAINTTAMGAILVVQGISSVLWLFVGNNNVSHSYGNVASYWVGLFGVVLLVVAMTIAVPYFKKVRGKIFRMEKNEKVL